MDEGVSWRFVVGRVKGRFGCSGPWVWFDGKGLRRIAELLVVYRRLFGALSLMVWKEWKAWVWVKVKESWSVRR